MGPLTGSRPSGRTRARACRTTTAPSWSRPCARPSSPARWRPSGPRWSACRSACSSCSRCGRSQSTVRRARATRSTQGSSPGWPRTTALWCCRRASSTWSRWDSWRCPSSRCSGPGAGPVAPRPRRCPRPSARPSRWRSCTASVPAWSPPPAHSAAPPPRWAARCSAPRCSRWSPAARACCTVASCGTTCGRHCPSRPNRSCARRPPVWLSWSAVAPSWWPPRSPGTQAASPSSPARSGSARRASSACCSCACSPYRRPSCGPRRTPSARGSPSGSARRWLRAGSASGRSPRCPCWARSPTPGTRPASRWSPWRSPRWPASWSAGSPRAGPLPDRDRSPVARRARRSSRVAWRASGWEYSPH